MTTVRLYNAMSTSTGMDQSEIDHFLASSKTPLRLGTTNEKNEPNIHPVWYQYANKKIYLVTGKDSLKVRNMKRNKTIYFTVDTDQLPAKGVKGKGTASIVKDSGTSLSMSEKIIAKYLGDLNGSLAKALVNAVKKGSEVLVEITPSYFSTWDDSKSKS